MENVILFVNLFIWSYALFSFLPTGLLCNVGMNFTVGERVRILGSKRKSNTIQFLKVFETSFHYALDHLFLAPLLGIFNQVTLLLFPLILFYFFIAINYFNPNSRNAAHFDGFLGYFWFYGLSLQHTIRIIV